MASPTNRRVVIVGGGLAGLAAATRCARLGLSPIVLEKRGYLGGRAFSFVDRDTGVEVDNGQHVFVGACTEYREFLQEIGAWHLVYEQPRLDIPVLRDGVVSRLSWSRISGLRMLPSLLAYRHLGFIDRLRVIYGVVRLRMVNRERDSLDAETFKHWLERHGQNQSTITRLWNLIVLPALNDDIGDVSAHAGVTLFRTALLKGRSEATIGYPRVGLSALAGEPTLTHLSATGGEVRRACEVEALEMEDGRVARARLTDGSVLDGDSFIVAVPHNALSDVLPSEVAADPSIATAAQLETAPIVGVHIWYDRPVLDEEFIAVLDSPLQFIFNVTALHPSEPVDPPGGQHVVISLSGAHRWVQLDRSELRELFVAEMARAFPAAAGANVTRFLSVKQVHATFRVVPGAEAHRPPQRTPVANLFLAGDWTRTGWPSTMESAVRSGNLAAEAAAAALGADGGD